MIDCFHTELRVDSKRYKRPKVDHRIQNIEKIRIYRPVCGPLNTWVVLWWLWHLRGSPTHIGRFLTHMLGCMLTKEWRSSVVGRGCIIFWVWMSEALVHESARWMPKSSEPTSTSPLMTISTMIRCWPFFFVRLGPTLIAWPWHWT